VKRLILAIAIPVLLVTVIFGSTVMGAPESKPLDTWDYIADTVGEILDKVGDIWDEITGVADDVEALDDRITSLNESSIARMMNDQDIVYMLVAEDAAISDELVYESPTFYEGAHFTVSIWVIDGDDPSDHIKIQHSNWAQDRSQAVTSAFRVDGEDFYTFEFDAGKCALTYTFNDSNDFKFTWAVTVEYSSSSFGD